MKRITAIFLIIPFALIMLLPGIQKELKMIKVEPLYGAYDRTRMLDITGENWFSGEFQRHFEVYLRDNIGLHPVFIRIFNQYSFTLFNMSNYFGVAIGKNRVLYQPGYLETYKGEDFIGSARIDAFACKLKVVQDELQRRDKFFLFIIAPGKVNIYPEIIPERIGLERADTTNLEVIKRCFDQYHINYIDFTDYFISIKDSIRYPLFPKYGTHWSGYASGLVLDSILRRIETETREKIINYTKLPGHATTKDIRFTDNDLGKLLNLLLPLKPDTVYYPIYNFNEAKQKPEKKLLIVGDSFCQSFWGFDNVFPRVFSDSSMFWGYYRHKEWPANPSLALPINYIYLDEYISKIDIILLESVDENLELLGYEFVDDLYYLFTHPGSSEEYLAGRLRENIIFHAKRNKDQYVVQKMANDMQISVDSAYQVFAYQTQKKIYETRQVFY